MPHQCWLTFRVIEWAKCNIVIMQLYSNFQENKSIKSNIIVPDTCPNLCRRICNTDSSNAPQTEQPLYDVKPLRYLFKFVIKRPWNTLFQRPNMSQNPWIWIVEDWQGQIICYFIENKSVDVCLHEFPASTWAIEQWRTVAWISPLATFTNGVSTNQTSN